MSKEEFADLAFYIWVASGIILFIAQVYRIKKVNKEFTFGDLLLTLLTSMSGTMGLLAVIILVLVTWNGWSRLLKAKIF